MILLRRLLRFLFIQLLRNSSCSQLFTTLDYLQPGLLKVVSNVCHVLSIFCFLCDLMFIIHFSFKLVLDLFNVRSVLCLQHSLDLCVVCLDVCLHFELRGSLHVAAVFQFKLTFVISTTSLTVKRRSSFQTLSTFINCFTFLKPRGNAVGLKIPGILCLLLTFSLRNLPLVIYRPRCILLTLSP